MASVVYRFLTAVWTFVCAFLLANAAFAGNFALTWGTAPYTWTASSLGPNTYTLTDQYGFQVQVRFTVVRNNGTSAGPFPDDLTTDGGGNTFGTQTSIWQVWNPNLTGGGIGGSTNTGTLEILNGATPVGVNGLSFRASDIDAVDSNNASFTNDRCDHVTFTGNNGNPTLTAVTGTPTYLLGPGPGAGASPALAANQVQCNFQVSTGVTSPTSNGDDNGTVLATYPNNTSVATVQYNESIHNVSGITSVNALARGIGIWAATAFTVNNTISLDKQTTSTGFAAAGDIIPYTYVVTNNGPLPLLSTQNVTIQDNKIASVTCPAIPAAGIPSGGTLSCTGNYTVLATDVTAGLVTNIATAGVGVGAQTFATRLQSPTDTVTVRRFARLTLVKTITNDNGGTATTSAFTLSAAGPTPLSGISGNAAVTNVSVQPGSYTLSETAVTGYLGGAWSCTAGTLSGSTLTLTSGQTATCTINNNDVAPRLTLVKTVTNDNGGTATTSSVTLSATGPTTISGLSGAAAVTNAAVNAGTYTLAETALANYTASAWSCTAGTLTGSSLVLSIGQTATCTINNNDIAPRLTLVKTVTNDNGGTATTSSVTLSATGPTTISGLSGAAAVTNAAVNAGTYTLAETALANYTPSAWSCTAGTLTGSSLVLTIGQTATCTINNDDIAPRLTLVKTITNDNGGTATTSSVTLSATGPTTISGLSGAAAVTNAAVNAGTYTLAETALANYTASAWSCTAGTLTGSSLVLTIGQTATCTINNNDIAPRLTLVKTVTNDHGGTATTTSVTLSASGPTTISGVSGSATVTNAAVNAGTYTLAETALANYTPSAWSCTAGTLTGSSLVLTIGQTATCTINNDDIAPRLTLVKTVTNDNGGTATITSFTLSATGPTTISGTSGAAAVTNAIVTAGTYALAETNVAGYAAGAWSCTAGTLTGSNLAIGIGQSSTCTINNNDIAPVLTLVKTVTNDNGGTATTASFTLSATGPVTISGVSGAGSVTNAAVSAGSYALAETTVAGYAASAWSCTAGSLAGSNLTLALGQNATCTINNNDIAPRLTLVKTVTNDNGGTATTAAFTLTATGPTTISGLSGAGTVTNAAVNAGTYALSETNVAGYAASAWSCTSGSLTGSNLDLTIGQTATCTINNNDIAPVLTLVKTVTDTSGGPSTVGAFTVTATGPLTISGVTGAAAITSAPVTAGTYALTESGPAGYTAGAWSCSAGTLTGSSLALALGQTSTCTINNIKLPTLTLRKISNGGVGSFGFSGTNGVTTQNIVTVTAGSTVTGSTFVLAAADTSTAITETMPATFWQIQTATCTGMGTGGTATVAGNVLTLNTLATAAGRDIVCTFTNRRRPTVSVQKITTGAAGGAFSFADTNLTGTVANITTTATNTATPATGTRLIATTTGTGVTLTETSPLTFVSAGVTCSDANSAISGNTNPVATSTTGAVSIAAAAVRVGADINCVFTNAQANPQLSLVKTAGTASVSAAGSVVTYTLAVNNSGNTTLNSISVTDPLGTVICPSSGAATVTTLAAGASENCTLSYTVPQSAFDTNGGGDGDIDNTATASATYNASPVSANDSDTVALVITPGLTVEKIPNTSAPQNAGNVIGYTYRVTNSGNVTMNNVTISDAHVGYGTTPVPGNETLVSAPGSSTDAAMNGTWDVLAPGDIIEFTSTYTVVQADIDNLQ
jgi:uncharacterized repeat protein (TIGR01451 family)